MVTKFWDSPCGFGSRQPCEKERARFCWTTNLRFHFIFSKSGNIPPSFWDDSPRQSPHLYQCREPQNKYQPPKIAGWTCWKPVLDNLLHCKSIFIEVVPPKRRRRRRPAHLKPGLWPVGAWPQDSTEDFAPNWLGCAVDFHPNSGNMRVGSHKGVMV